MFRVRVFEGSHNKDNGIGGPCWGAPTETTIHPMSGHIGPEYGPLPVSWALTRNYRLFRFVRNYTVYKDPRSKGPYQV